MITKNKDINSKEGIEKYLTELDTEKNKILNLVTALEEKKQSIVSFIGSENSQTSLKLVMKITENLDEQLNNLRTKVDVMDTNIKASSNTLEKSKDFIGW